MAVGRVENRITITGKDAASAKIDKVSESMSRMDRAAAKIKSGIGDAAFAMNQFTGAASSVIGAATSLAAFVKEGERAINVTRAAQATLDDYAGSMNDARKATAGLVEGTDIEVFLTKTAKLGITGAQQTKALEVATKAALSLGITVEQALAKVEQAARGETKEALASLGVLLERETAVLEYRQKHGLLLETLSKEDEALGIVEIALTKLDEKYADTNVDQFATNVSKAETFLGDLKSTAASMAATGIFESFFQAGNEILEDNAKTTAQATAEVRDYVAQLQEAGGVLELVTRQIAEDTTAREANKIMVAAQRAEIEAQLARAGQISEAYERWQQESRGLSDQQMNVENWIKRVAAAEGQLASMLRGKTDTQAEAIRQTREYADAAEGLALAQRNLQIATAAANAEMASQLAIGGAVTAKVLADLRAMGIDPTKSKGTGGSGTRKDPQEELRDLLRSISDKAPTIAPKQLMGPMFSDPNQGVLDGISSMLGGGESADTTIAKLLENVRATEFAELAKGVQSFSAAFSEMGSVLQTVSPEIAAVMEGVTVATSDWTEAQSSAAGVVDKVLAGSQRLAAGLIKDAQAQAIVQAALETGRGFAAAAIGNIPESVAHFAAAAAFGVAAATGGGGGKKGTTGSGLTKPVRPSRSRGNEGGGTTVVNINGVYATEQQVGAALNRYVRATDGTGMAGGAI